MRLSESCGGWVIKWPDGRLQGWYPSKTKAHRAMASVVTADDGGFEIRCYQCDPES